MVDDYSTEQFKATQLFDEIVWHLRSNLAVRTNRKDLVMTAENSFTGKEAVEFLLLEVPRIVPGKVPTRDNMEKLLEMMVEWKVIAEAFPKRTPKKRQFSESRIYIFAKSLDELKKPKPRSRRSASFSGARKSAKLATGTSPAAATMSRAPKARMSRRLSRSNGNVDKAGLENPGFEDRKEDPAQEKEKEKEPEKQKPPKILNRSLESICMNQEEHEEPEGRKERVYDWLPFFKSKRFAQKAQTRRSVSLDRNHCVLEQEAAAAAAHQNQNKVSSPPSRELNDDLVYMHPKGPLPPAPSNKYHHHRASIVHSNPNPLTRGRMYESIMRRSSVAPMINEPLPVLKDALIWKTELLARLSCLYDAPLPHEWSSKLDGYDIQWNMQEIDVMDGIVKSRCAGTQPDYPSTIVQFMDYLGRYPFSASKKNELVPEHNVSRMFCTLVNRLEDLNAPLHIDECSLIISLLTKMDSFAAMLETGAARRWSRAMPPSISSMSASSIEEAGLLSDEFSRELPLNFRASKHRRRALSPFNNRMNVSVQEEKSYKLREPWLIESIQLVLLSLPTSRLRKLHKFVLFIKSLATNEVFDIADPSNGSSNNREAAIIGLWTGICGGFRKAPGILITAVLLANYRALFVPPDDFVDRLRILEQRDASHEGNRYEKLSRGRRSRKTMDTPPPPIIPKRTIDPEKTAPSRKAGLFTRLLRK